MFSLFSINNFANRVLIDINDVMVFRLANTSPFSTYCLFSNQMAHDKQNTIRKLTVFLCESIRAHHSQWLLVATNHIFIFQSIFLLDGVWCFCRSGSLCFSTIWNNITDSVCKVCTFWPSKWKTDEHTIEFHSRITNLYHSSVWAWIDDKRASHMNMHSNYMQTILQF